MDLNDLEKIEGISEEIKSAISTERKKKYTRFLLAALSSVSWVGGIFGVASTWDSEKSQDRMNNLHEQWVSVHTEKLKDLVATLGEILSRLEKFGDEIQERIEAPEYLNLIRKGFRSWDEADTEEKRNLIKQLLMNAGATKLCPDDLVRLFIDWINYYHESHFKVIRVIHQQPGATRGQIWDSIHGERPREDSAEADLFRLLIRDLSTGGVIRQQRETTYSGEFVSKRRGKRSSSGVMKSAFDDIEPYELTELGRQFVHYTMNEVVTRIT